MTDGISVSAAEMMLERIEALERMVAELTRRIEALTGKPEQTNWGKQ